MHYLARSSSFITAIQIGSCTRTWNNKPQTLSRCLSDDRWRQFRLSALRHQNSEIINHKQCFLIFQIQWRSSKKTPLRFEFAKDLYSRKVYFFYSKNKVDRKFNDNIYKNVRTILTVGISLGCSTRFIYFLNFIFELWLVFGILRCCVDEINTILQWAAVLWFASIYFRYYYACVIPFFYEAQGSSARFLYSIRSYRIQYTYVFGVVRAFYTTFI